MVGAVTGIGLLEGRGAFNWRLLFKFFIGWVGTLIIAGATAAAFTAQVCAHGCGWVPGSLAGCVCLGPAPMPTLRCAALHGVVQCN